jgi:hypothetical protein
VTRSLGEKEGEAAASQLLEQREAEAARRQQTETEQQVSLLFKQTERGINDQLSANLVVPSEEKIQNIIREALAKAANDAAQQPTPKYSFNPLSGTLTFKKPWVMTNGVEVKEINLYGTLAALDGAKYILECVKNKNVSECVADLLKSLENKLAYSGSQINEE